LLDFRDTTSKGGEGREEGKTGDGRKGIKGEGKRVKGDKLGKEKEGSRGPSN